MQDLAALLPQRERGRFVSVLDETCLTTRR